MAVIKTVQEESLVALGDAIREKAGTNEPLVFPTGMIEAIANITTGGGEVEPLVLTGVQSHGCRGALAGAYINLFGDTITTKNIVNGGYMFAGNTAKRIPFDINFDKTASYCDTAYMFNNCTELVALPRVLNLKAYTMNNMFSNCEKLKEIPQDFTDTWDFSNVIKTTNSGYNYSSSNMFYNCKSLRSIPRVFLEKVNPQAVYSYTYFYSGFGFCYMLDELVNLPLPYTAVMTSNMFLSTFYSNSRLKALTFATNEDGTPLIKQWKSQTLDLLNNIGYAPYADTLLGCGAVIDKQVLDNATYQALKNDPDCWTAKLEYSRYNHDSAVETINSLPDTSAYLTTAGGTNTIKFKGAAGSATDGGAINTLTEEEIAVATAKGWTVSFA